jgi:hypothetical protein
MAVIGQRDQVAQIADVHRRRISGAGDARIGAS